MSAIPGSMDRLKPVAAYETPDFKTLVLKLSGVSPGMMEANNSPRAPFVVTPQ